MKGLEHHVHKFEFYSVRCGHVRKYFEKESDMKRALLLKAHAGTHTQGEWDIDGAELCRERGIVRQRI